MTSESKPRLLRALVVDDEWAVRSLISSALTNEAFICDVASSVDEALEFVSRERYDLVVTDLVMPNRHGHSLVVELLGLADRPRICVLTGVLEPRIAKDLIARGVDDLAFKPVPVHSFAATIRALVDRGLRQKAQRETTTQELPDGTSRAALGRFARVDEDELRTRLRAMPRIPPVSEAAIEVYKLTTEGNAGSQQVAAAVQREPALIADVLRLANSSFFNPSVRKITDVEQAVVRLGQKRVGELALSTAVFAAVSQKQVSFFPLSDTWRKCLGAGICMEMLLQHCQGIEAPAGLFCTSVLQPMGRVLLASAFPDIYQRVIDQCRATKKPLAELENHVFPESPGEVAATILASWGIPDSIHRPLRHTNLAFNALASVPALLRRRVELIKVAAFLSDLVVAEFEDWDLIDIPPATLLDRIGISSVDETIHQCRQDLMQIATFGISEQSGANSAKTSESRTPTSPPIELAYKRLQSEAIDFLPHFVRCTGRRVQSVDQIPDNGPVVINAVSTPVHKVVGALRNRPPHQTVIVADAENGERFQESGKVVTLPCSFQLLTETLASVTQFGPAVKNTGHHELPTSMSHAAL